MTKQHFVALADSIRAHNSAALASADPLAAPFTVEQIQTLAEFCAAQNPAFNRSRWLAYIAGDCGPNGGKRKS